MVKLGIATAYAIAFIVVSLEHVRDALYYYYLRLFYDIDLVDRSK